MRLSNHADLHRSLHTCLMKKWDLGYRRHCVVLTSVSANQVRRRRSPSCVLRSESFRLNPGISGYGLFKPESTDMFSPVCLSSILFMTLERYGSSIVWVNTLCVRLEPPGSVELQPGGVLVNYPQTSQCPNRNQGQPHRKLMCSQPIKASGRRDYSEGETLEKGSMNQRA